jgi:choline-glycine betaine transporter
MIRFIREQGVVFWFSTIVIVGFVLAGLVSMAATEQVLKDINAFIMTHLSWVFVVGMAVFVLVVLCELHPLSRTHNYGRPSRQ